MAGYTDEQLGVVLAKLTIAGHQAREMGVNAGDIRLPAANQQKQPAIDGAGAVTFPAGANIDGSKLISENNKYNI